MFPKIYVTGQCTTVTSTHTNMSITITPYAEKSEIALLQKTTDKSLIGSCRWHVIVVNLFTVADIYVLVLRR